ncbi:longitudinals lacking protein, isoforms N/O/W/X/Y-like isoform X2 [Tachypleus tridentatus]|uniref:longitudinals lacking protein, isoforms N/O/W/X/Y-like isoform X2 n=1 Tax=Tachypleus tridentatus TaxID=6853 RepID=UPI003FD4D92E
MTVSDKYPKPFVCERCGKSYATKAALRGHQYQDCSSTLSYPCPYCGKLANQQCVVCNQKLNSRAALKRHMKIHFPSREKFACFLCGTVVSRKDHLNRHMRWQHKDLVFICPICKRLFMSNDELNYHLANSHKDNFEMVSILSMERPPIKYMKTEEKED